MGALIYYDVLRSRSSLTLASDTSEVVAMIPLQRDRISKYDGYIINDIERRNTFFTEFLARN